MTKPTDDKPRESFDYCIDFWEGALDPEDEIDHHIRKLPRHARAFDDVAYGDDKSALGAK